MANSPYKNDSVNRETFSFMLDGKSLQVEDVFRFLAAESCEVKLEPEAAGNVKASNDQVRKWLAEGRPIYGLTRGLGPLKDKVLVSEEQIDFQMRILESHATGIGQPFCDQISRIALLLRANVASSGSFGIRIDLIQRYLDLLNAGVIPIMPWEGSLGSGDLQPMAALGLVMAGSPHGVAKYNGDIGSAPDILARAGVDPLFTLEIEEALSIISGSTVLAAGAVYSLYRIKHLLYVMEACFALTMEALRGEIGALDYRIHESRDIPGQIISAHTARTLLKGSEWTTDEGRARLGEVNPRIQDAVSLRSTPHIYGSLRETYSFVSDAMNREINAASMNPLVFRNIEQPDCFDVVMGGNYDGSHMAHLLDYLNIVLTDVAGLSESRSARLISPQASYGLPANLAGGQPGLNSGMVQVQSLQLSIIGQMRQQATPASIHSLSGKSMQEDHNSMGNSSLYDLQLNLDMCEQVLAIELMLAAQAIDLIRDRMHPMKMSPKTEAIHTLIRSHIEMVMEDRFLREDIEALIDLVRGQELAALVENLLEE
ncbi:MAG: aromatic amino acid lyase [Balneola sp.]|nr:MAG: aromatic amino acid lyase [Balneola sp.]